MKKSLPIFVALLLTILVYSCQKSGVNPGNSLIGKWNIKVDSLDYGIGPNQQTKIYVGTPGDYYDFRNNNKLYIKEGVELDTFNYKVISQNKLQITTSNPNSIPQNLFIDDINGSSANITISATLLNPGGNDVRWVSLSK